MGPSVSQIIPRQDFLPFNLPSIGPEEEAEILDTLRSGWLTTGPKTRQFEEEFAAYTGCPNAIALNSCTAALHVAMVAAGLGPGDEVITPSLTFPSATNEMIHEGIHPVLVDVEPDTLNLDVARVEERITARTRAIVPVHFAGHPVEQDRLQELARQHGLLILGDAAHATESRFRARHVSQWEDATAYSFYATKNLCTGEGGMLTAASRELAEKARLLSLHGMSRDAWKRYTEEGYKHWDIVVPGFKYNMPDLQACLGIHQLRKLPEFTRRREQLTLAYDDAFSDLSALLAPLRRRPYVESAYHLYVVCVKTENLKAGRDEILNQIQSYNIGVGVHFRAVHLHSWYRSHFGYREGMLPHTEYAGDRVISLPLYPAMTDEDQAYVIEVVRSILLRHRR
ncbi:MAG: DegT/DnrJ/EryC1/StrS aminotransferase family protein [Armatimonadetes bacterium]|nr:DegT/DnrJ/EryC1/StrS aminotransferase family protein [Armatimonadota bacterium]